MLRGGEFLILCHEVLDLTRQRMGYHEVHEHTQGEFIEYLGNARTMIRRPALLYSTNLRHRRAELSQGDWLFMTGLQASMAAGTLIRWTAAIHQNRLDSVPEWGCLQGTLQEPS